MPVRNVIRYQASNTLYHVYNRGHNRDLLFADEEDYAFFFWLLERFLRGETLSTSPPLHETLST